MGDGDPDAAFLAYPAGTEIPDRGGDAGRARRWWQGGTEASRQGRGETGRSTRPMHPEAMEWVAKHATGDPVSVLDLGGRYINGSPRELFPNATTLHGARHRPRP